MKMIMSKVSRAFSFLKSLSILKVLNPGLNIEPLVNFVGSRPLDEKVYCFTVSLHDGYVFPCENDRQFFRTSLLCGFRLSVK